MTTAHQWTWISHHPEREQNRFSSLLLFPLVSWTHRVSSQPRRAAERGSSALPQCSAFPWFIAKSIYTVSLNCQPRNRHLTVYIFAYLRAVIARLCSRTRMEDVDIDDTSNSGQQRMKLFVNGVWAGRLSLAIIYHAIYNDKEIDKGRYHGTCSRTKYSGVMSCTQRCIPLLSCGCSVP